MNLVILTSGDYNGRILSRILTEKQIQHDVIICSYPLSKNWFRKKRGALILLKFFLSKLNWVRMLRYRNLPPYGVNPTFAGTTNSKKSKQILKSVNPDIVILMGGGIIDKETISIPKRGIINAHPGILPEVRGMNPIEHSILANIPIGATLHYVAEKIDAGEIIQRKLIPIKENDKHYHLVERNDRICLEMIVDFLTDTMQGQSYPAESQKSLGKYYRSLSQEDMDLVKVKLESGEVYANFAKYSTYTEIEIGKDKYQDYFALHQS